MISVVIKRVEGVAMRDGRKRYQSLATAAVAFLLLACSCSGVSEDSLVVHFIDVGQGDAILIDYGEYEMLIDGGRWGQCAGYLVSRIDGPLEVMVATHPDVDHIEGLVYVLENFEVEEIWMNRDTSDTKTYQRFLEAVENERAQVLYARKGRQITLGALVFDVLHPDPYTSATFTKNDNSIVLKLSFGEVDFLFAADIEGKAEAALIAANLVDETEVLKVSDHGSEYCSTEGFLLVVQPEVAIYSAGKNPYGHPSSEALARLRAVGTMTFGTDTYGSIRVVTDGVSYFVQTEKGDLSVSPDT